MKTLNTVILVSNDEKDLYYWEQELKECSTCKVIVADSILDAIKHWNKCYIKGAVPKAIISNWILEEAEVETIKDGIIKSGSHYMLDYCNNMVDGNEVMFFIYTSAPEFVREKLSGLKEAEKTKVLSKKQYSIHDAFQIIRQALNPITNPSGFHNIHA